MDLISTKRLRQMMAHKDNSITLVMIHREDAETIYIDTVYLDGKCTGIIGRGIPVSSSGDISACLEHAPSKSGPWEPLTDKLITQERMYFQSHENAYAVTLHEAEILLPILPPGPHLMLITS